MYREEQKQQTLALLKAGRSINEVSKETGIGRSTIYRWIDEERAQINAEELEGEWDRNERFQEDVFQNAASFRDDPERHEEDIPAQNYDEEEDSFNTVPYKQDAFHDESHSYLSKKDSFPNRLNSNAKANETWRDSGQEVEKLRLRLDHEYKMEMLRQKNKTLELEEQKLKNQQYELTIKEQQLQQQKQAQLQAALQEAKSREENKRKLLQQVKKKVQYIQKSSRAQSWDQKALKDLFQQLINLQQQVEEQADALEQDYESWQVWQSLNVIIYAIEEAEEQISRSFFKDTVELDWDQKEEEALQTILDLYALDQLLENEDDPEP